MVDPEFFELFNYTWLIGSPEVLAQPNVVVLSRKYADKYFQDYQKAVGQYVKINNLTTMRVGGVLEDAPVTTDFPLNLVLSYESKRARPELFGFGKFDNWGSTSSSDQIFVLLPESFSVASANTLLEKFSRKHYNKRKDNDIKTHSLSPLADVHHDERFSNYKDKVVPRQRIRNIAIVGSPVVADGLHQLHQHILRTGLQTRQGGRGTQSTGQPEKSAGGAVSDRDVPGGAVLHGCGCLASVCGLADARKRYFPYRPILPCTLPRSWACTCWAF